ncbi:sulfite exporter TauE/SafE family protein [Thermosulfurimonas sp. F29]|uniref:sulfite exporter TauE/SafE family protein n=1 Tax=Thermosulfurimonas sp. F29 TaxID=2867247 RepID=UPI001C82EE5A|nr:sulfite exporter TauE/SafE family protein [Thermosulfurimonas sp. F29]MBX6422709.1 sulfite exporter TauE/SafE family protein [Thermosulfurimonas sp. F29]
MRLIKRLWFPALVVGTLVWLYFSRDTLAAEVPAKPGWPWWVWPTILFLFTFTIGIISPMSGVGGGVLFVPLSTAFFPFSVDFIRGAGLIMAVTSAYSSVPSFARTGLANIRLMAAVGWVVMVSSIIGGFVGLWVSNAFPNGKWYIIFALGLILLAVFIIMITSKRVEYPEVKEQDGISKALGLKGSWFEPTLGRVVEYKITRFTLSLFLFAGVGFIAGMFGLGAGWANVPVLNLVMGCPIKVAVATSMAIIMVNAAAIWVYMAKGATLPLIVVPAVLGITIGARVGAWLTVRVKPAFIKYLVLGIMLLAAILNVIKALKGLHVI